MPRDPSPIRPWVQTSPSYLCGIDAPIMVTEVGEAARSAGSRAPRLSTIPSPPEPTYHWESIPIAPAFCDELAAVWYQTAITRLLAAQCDIFDTYQPLLPPVPHLNIETDNGTRMTGSIVAAGRTAAQRAIAAPRLRAQSGRCPLYFWGSTTVSTAHLSLSRNPTDTSGFCGAVSPNVQWQRPRLNRLARSLPARHVAVIGTGPCGLWIAARLRRSQAPCRFFAIPVQIWRQHMPEGLV